MNRAGISRMLLVLLVAFMLRAVLLGIPPVLEQMRRSLGLSHLVAGLVVGLPVLMLGVSALPGASLARRIGAGRAVTLGLALLTFGGLLRVAPGGLLTVMAGTLILAVGIGMAQPPLSRMVQLWFPGQVQRAATLMTVGLLGGGIAGAAVTPLAVRSVARDWRGSFVFWAAPAVLVLAAWTVSTRRSPAAPIAEARVALRPLLADRRVRWVTVLFAGQAAIFYTSNTWTASASSGGAAGSAAAVNLLCLNVAALPITLVLSTTDRPFSKSRRFYLLGALLCCVGALGWIAVGPNLGALWSVLLGAGSSMVLAGSMAYIPSSFPPNQVAAAAAAVWTTGYLVAFVGPPAAGLGIDVLHNTRAPFILAFAGAIALALAGISPPVARRSVSRHRLAPGTRREQ